MKKVFLSLAFVLAISSSALNASDNNIIKPNVDGNIEQCLEFAIEIAGILAIYNNNSFEEEDADVEYFFDLCMETP